MEIIIFEVIDKTTRKIKLTQKSWKHIRDEHPEIEDQEEIASALKIPNKILSSDRDESVAWYFFYKKERREYLKVSVKYLNGEGFIITAHHTSKLQ
ncbi:MAG TPA: hypothetical protein VJK51_01890 [Candidatus Nanoarchaeia archaeon]|nr:hypothetical protein [Candidatus Nanoarchaeia archaeon]